MYDRDILALQVGASVTPAETFLVQILHKFALLEWVRYVELRKENRFVEHRFFVLERQKMVVIQVRKRK